MTGVFIGAAFFACAGWLGVLLSQAVCASCERAPDSPPAQKTPIALLIAACALIGAILIAHNVASWQLAAYALVCLTLVACWYSDAQCGMVPDVFTLIPLSLFLAITIWSRNWWYISSTLIPLVPFITAALFTKGYGLGWGDVKLAALGGLVVGAPAALITFTAAGIVAILVNRLQKTSSGPIAFAPYLVSAIGVAIPLGVLV